jgi:hypothetical protein
MSNNEPNEICDATNIPFAPIGSFKMIVDK